MSTWVFVRHGQSHANRDGYYAGSFDSPLTDLGREQARQARPAVHHHRITAAVCSDLVRAHETATILLDGHDLPLLRTDQLRERSAGDWERRSIAEVKATTDAKHRMATWDQAPPNGESLRDVALRASRQLAELADAETTLVVSHGALMRALLGALAASERGARPDETIGSWRPDNCEVVVRTLQFGAWAQLHARLAAEPGANA